MHATCINNVYACPAHNGNGNMCIAYTCYLFSPQIVPGMCCLRVMFNRFRDVTFQYNLRYTYMIYESLH